MMPAQPGLCGASSGQAEVFTGLITRGSNTPGVKLGFYIVFY